MAQFDASPPSPYNNNWKEAYKSESGDLPRFTTYQAPDGQPIPFIQKSFTFSGGQSVDTAEYPFNGLWSNERLNEKTQKLTIEGFLRGPEYIGKRNALIQALRAATDDDNPGYIDFPFWGRFPVVVVDYEIGEHTDEQGQCSVSLTFTRAGVTLESRLAAIPDVSGLFEDTKAKLQTAASADYAKTLEGTLDTDTIAEVFTQLKTGLLNIVGRVQAEKSRLENITAQVSGFSNLISQGIRAPSELSKAFLSSCTAIVGSVLEIAQTIEGTYLDGGTVLSGPIARYLTQGENNQKNVLMQFLSATEYSLNMETVTVVQQNTKTATENLYRTAALLCASELLLQMDNPSYQATSGYWKLLQKLEASINQNNPDVYTAIEETRIAVSRNLSALDLSNEMRRFINTPLPLLFLAHYLGCDEAKLRQLNSIADSFVVSGSVIYV